MKEKLFDLPHSVDFGHKLPDWRRTKDAEPDDDDHDDTPQPGVKDALKQLGLSTKDVEGFDR